MQKLLSILTFVTTIALTQAKAKPLLPPFQAVAVAITNFSAQIFLGEDVVKYAKFIIHTRSENITCTFLGVMHISTYCDSDFAWRFIISFLSANNTMDLSVYEQIDMSRPNGKNIGGEIFIPLSCQKVNGTGVGTEDCVSLASVNGDGEPIIVTLT